MVSFRRAKDDGIGGAEGKDEDEKEGIVVVEGLAVGTLDVCTRVSDR